MRLGRPRPLGTLVASLLLAVSLAGCFDGDEKAGPSTPEPGVDHPAGSVRFIAMGDAGTGTQGQYDVADTIADVCAVKSCDFVVYMGDNFYPAGVDSEYDPQWEEKFEKPYAQLDLPFYAALGNHDESFLIGEGLNTQKGDNEVAYHYREDRSSDKWRMPARWYNFTAGTDAVGMPLVEFFAMDTNVENVGQGDGSQAAWLQEGFSESQATWTFAFGHHLYSSNSLHGQSAESGVYFFNGDLMRRFFQENVCGRADILWSGHDHILEWLHPRSGCSGTELIISGAGSSGREITGDEPSYYTYGAGPGFAWVEVTGNRMDLEYYHAGETEPSFRRTLMKSDVGANEFTESRSTSPYPIPDRRHRSTSFIAYADGGHDRPAQIRNSQAATRVCNDLGCDMVLHVTGTIGDWSAHAPEPERFQWTWGAGLVEYFRVDADGDVAAQEAWLLNALDASTATWKVVYAEEPYVANGRPGAAGENPALAALVQSVVCGRADLFVTGGSHTLEWIEAPTCPGTQFVVAGASSTFDPIERALFPHEFAYDEGLGFWWTHATEEFLEARAFDDDADELFTVTLRP